MKASDNNFPSVLFTNREDNPGTPSAGTVRLFVRQGIVCLIDSEGEVFQVGLDLPLIAKGDLLVYNGEGLARLPVGSDGQVLSAGSTEPAGLKWIDPPEPPDPGEPSAFSHGFSGGFGSGGNGNGNGPGPSGFSEGFNHGYGE